jgi:hypothetical protein
MYKEHAYNNSYRNMNIKAAPLLTIPPQLINYNNVLFDLQDFMLTSKTIVNSLSNRLLTEPKKKVKQPPIPKEIPITRPSIFIPKQTDTLFVCFYKIINKDVFDNENITFSEEKKLKIDYVDKLRKNKPLIKKYKFAAITHIENQLVNENKIDINTFLSLCVIENVNILYVRNKTFYELLMNDNESSNVHIIHFLDKLSKYGYEGFSDDKITHYRTTLYKVDNINKPLKAISFYKVQDLIDICNKLAIDTKTDTNKSKKKNDLYELIIQSL